MCFRVVFLSVLMVIMQDTTQMQLADLNHKNVGLQMQIEELKEREIQLRASNKVRHVKVAIFIYSDVLAKTLREEFRKVQSSAALLERQRNPGLGYWASRDNVTESRTSISSTSDLPSRVGSPVTSSQRNGNDEEVNLEYLRNIILQFLERKEMRVCLFLKVTGFTVTDG
jgi:GRIP domain